MMTLLPSYVNGSWWSPVAGTIGTSVRDASTGETMFEVSAAGLDLATVIDYARTTGHEGLAELTFHERAMKLKQLAQFLGGVKDELYAVSATTGATAGDSMIDIDGGIGVLFTYSSKGRRELPNSTVYVDGATEPLSKDGSFVGQHIYTSIPGVALQINAFNFPVWGMLEKFAPAFLAGVPTIAKPASPTAHLAEAAVRLMVDSGILPEGSLQLVSGSVPEILDHLDSRDLVAFTGSASTADRLRSHPNVVSGGLRFTSETDSLNAAILGPDALAGSPEFDAFVRSVVTEVTVKAGQKCTSIRRVIVPESAVDDVIEAIKVRIAERVIVGDPRGPGVTMGPLVSRDQRDEIVRSVRALVDGGGEFAIGSLAEPMVIWADGSAAEAPNGAFMAPVVLRFRDTVAEAVHTVEAFGPVTSVFGYRSLDDAVRLAALGGGSLVATVATHDPDTARTLVLGIAAHHGRVLVLDRDDARSSTGHGSPVPHLVHGGPGRAGGGEELGGIRAVLHHMQRTAVQGSPDMLTAVTGQWHTGALRQVSAEHPFRKSLKRLRIGDSVETGPREITLDDISHFAEFTGDRFYAHTDEEAAAANPFFPGRVAHGYLLVSWAAGLFVDPAPGPVLANYGLENLRFLAPVSPGDSVHVTLTAKQITPRENEEYGEVRWDAVLQNQRDEPVATYDVLTLVSKT